MDRGFPIVLIASFMGVFGLTWHLTGSGDPVAKAGPPAVAQQEIAPKTCEEAEALGLAPMMAGRPGYRAELDPDGTGVACPPASRPV